MKGFFLTDTQIDALVHEPKRLNRSSRAILHSMEAKKGREMLHEQASIVFPRNADEGKWRIYLRLSKKNSLDFSCGIGFIPAGRKSDFTIRRYNGKSHEHTNWLDGVAPFYGFHIHRATEQYQQSSYADDHYAEPTELYTDFYGAFKTLLSECNVTVTDEQVIFQENLF